MMSPGCVLLATCGSMCRRSCAGCRRRATAPSWRRSTRASSPPSPVRKSTRKREAVAAIGEGQRLKELSINDFGKLSTTCYTINSLLHDTLLHTCTHTLLTTSLSVSLVGLEGGGNVTRLGRYANLRSILPNPDVTFIEMTAKTIGQ